MRLPSLCLRLRKLLPIGMTLAMLAGCDAASFESPPDGAALACDPRLVSEWYTGEWASYGAQEPRPKHADTEFLRIEARGCEPISRKTGKRPGDLRDYTLSYLPDAAGGYVVAIHDRDDGDDGGQQTGDENAPSPPRDAVQIFRYTASADRIAFHQVDPLRMARLIAIGQARGTIDSETDEGRRKIATLRQLDALLAAAKAAGEDPRVSTYTTGSPAQVGALLATHRDLFYFSPMGILRRVEPARAAATSPVGSPPGR